MKKASPPKWIGIWASRLLLMSVFLFAAQTLYADPIDFTFATLPANGIITGAAGSTIGWGYSLTNLSSTNWLMITALNAGSFLMGTPDASIFDFPILAPSGTLTVTFVPGLSGLFQFSWDTGAPNGFENSGIFVLSGELWDGDPFGGGAFAKLAADQSSSYTARVSSTSVPEPSILTLLALGAASVLLGRAYLTHSGRSRPSLLQIGRH